MRVRGGGDEGRRGVRGVRGGEERRVRGTTTCRNMLQAYIVRIAGTPRTSPLPGSWKKSQLP